MSDFNPSLLLVEDDPAISAFLVDNLRLDGYEVNSADTVHDAVRVLQFKKPSMCLVDVGLPDRSGLDLVRLIRQGDGVGSRWDPEIPLIILSGRAEEVDRVRGFERGCDDYVSKPFSYPELRLRLQAVLKRASVRPGRGLLRVGSLSIDPYTRDVRLAGLRIDLSQKEFALLQTFAAEPNRVFSKSELLRDIWGYQSSGCTRTIDSHICRLRKKLGPGWLSNVWGVGYRLTETPRQTSV